MASDLEGAQKPDDFTAVALKNLAGMKQADISSAMAERELWQGQLSLVQSSGDSAEHQTGQSPSHFL